MGLNAAALKLMQEKGLSLDDVVEIAAAMESRSKAAERQQRYRDRQRNKRDATSDVTPPPYEDTSTPQVNPSPDGDAPLPDCERVVGAWNEMAGRTGLRKVAKLNANRRKLLRARIGEHGVETMLAAIAKVELSDFCLGRTEKGGGWQANFDFLLSQSRCLRLIEGNYDNRGTKPQDVKIWAPGERESLAALNEARAGLSLEEFDAARREHFRRFGNGPDPPRQGGAVKIGSLVHQYGAGK